MTAKTDYLENGVINHVLGTSSLASPANVYLEVSTTAYAEDGTGGTPPTGGFTRQVVAWNAASGGSASNSGVVTFGPAVGSWGTITHGMVFDALTAGNPLYKAALDASRTINDGDTLRFQAGALVVTEQ